MTDTRRQFSWGWSAPNFAQGRCPACKKPVQLNNQAAYSDDTVVACISCGANTPRRRLVLEALCLIDTPTWNLFSSDIYMWDDSELTFPDTVSYDLKSVQVAKWQGHDAFPKAFESGMRYQADVVFFDSISEPSALLYLTDTLATTQAPDDPIPPTRATWWRFGVRELGSVPAWRQSLFGAASLVNSNPSAAVVLIAAGFEAFFTETMRIGWNERQLGQDAFDKLNRRNIAITSLIEWLPSAVGRQRLIEAPGNLHDKWSQLVNQRRNDVVHRANVHITSDQARESMRAALESMCFIDEAALVRPHVYYVNL